MTEQKKYEPIWQAHNIKASPKAKSFDGVGETPHQAAAACLGSMRFGRSRSDRIYVGLSWREVGTIWTITRMLKDPSIRIDASDDAVEALKEWKPDIEPMNR